jgi:GNAT superfamily N-acetyltransferase
MTQASLTLADIRSNPMLLMTSVPLRSGTSMLFRPLMPDDAPLLGSYFLGLSEETKRRFGPHPFDQATADQLCATINVDDTLRMIGLLHIDEQELLVAYFVLLMRVDEHAQTRYTQLGFTLDPETDCTVAPSVADSLQNQGVGSPLMIRLKEIARLLGRKRMLLMGGTQATNTRAVHFYEKHGFHTVGTFEYPAGRNNYDMICQL